MAVLSKIRQRSFFLILIIAFALFAFVLMDVLQSGTFSSSDNNIGSIAGEDINTQEFMQKEGFMEQSGQNMSGTQAINTVWEQESRRIILGKEFEKLGLGVANDQIINVIKQNPNFAQHPAFLNAAGIFDENKFKETLKSIKNAPNKDQWNQWLKDEENLKNYAVEQMYNTLVKAGVYSTKAEGKAVYELQSKKANFDYVTVQYTTINDSEVKITDQEILDYMKQNPKKYKSDPTRSIDFVNIENKPSKEDEDAMLSSINLVLNGGVKNGDTIPSFKNATKISDFVNAHSDIKYDSIYVAKKDLPMAYAEQLFNLGNGEVFGPYVDNGYQKISRMVAKKPNASAKASHILIAYKDAARSSATRTKEEAQKLATDLLAQAKANPANFAMLAMANTDDPGSKNTGGEYDNIQPGQMVPKFNDFVFNSAVGSIGLVETEFGYHVIKVSDKYNSVLLATVAQKVQPSDATTDANYTKASKFEEAAIANKDFEALAKKENLTVLPATNIKSFDEYVQGLGTNREIVRWAFNEDTSVGNIKRFETPSGFIIAKLKDINSSGLMPIDVAKPSVEMILKNKKKAEIIRKKFKGTTLEEVAKATGGSVQKATDVTLQGASIPNIGYEPKVVGKVFGLNKGKTSSVIDGNTGVFIVRTTEIINAPAINNYTSFIQQDSNQQKSSAASRAYSALKEKVKIVDDRAKL